MHIIEIIQILKLNYFFERAKSFYFDLWHLKKPLYTIQI